MTNQPDAPLVSIVMIFLDAGPYIREAVQSVLQQTYERWELLLVDDGSSDASTTIAREYASADPNRIRYLEHPGHQNCGTGASRRLGVSQARGEFIAFLDADDVYVPSRLQVHMDAFKRHPEADLVQCTMELWKSWNPAGGGDIRQKPPPVELDTTIAPPAMFRLLMQSGREIVPGTCSITLRSRFVTAVDSFSVAFRGLYEDQVMFAKMYLSGTTVVLEDCLARYRRHPGSLTNSASVSVELASRREYLGWLTRYLDQLNVQDPIIRRLLAEEVSQLRSSGTQQLRHLPAMLLRRMRVVAQHLLPPGLVRSLMQWWGRRKQAAAEARIARAANRLR
jgi:glycosyltransferase involved in cell wall biosynthesis